MNMRKYLNILLLLIIVFNKAMFSQQSKRNFLSETKAEKQQRMKWWKDARFGLFIHWGLYSVPAGEWKGDSTHAEWIRTTAQIPRSEEHTSELQSRELNSYA